MSQKYTIVIEPELHDWFAHRAIDVKSSISALISDAMDAYRRAYEPIMPASSVGLPTSSAASRSGDIPEAKPKKYEKSIYKANTMELNDTPRAREVSKATRKIVFILKKAKSAGTPAQELHNTLANAGFSFQSRRDALNYLSKNEVAKRLRVDWVLTEFHKPPSIKPR